MISSSSTADALWLDTLNRICGRAAHELKGVLNGVSVNLEVVRSRAAKPDAPASAVASFANSASTQFDAVMDMTEGLLALSRATSGPVDAGVTVRRLAALLIPVARADSKELTIDRSVDSFGVVSADGRAVRLALGSAMFAAVDAGTAASVRAANGAIEVAVEGGSFTPLADEVVAALKDAGIEMQAEPSAITITFPRDSRDGT